MFTAMKNDHFIIIESTKFNSGYSFLTVSHEQQLIIRKKALAFLNITYITARTATSRQPLKNQNWE